MAGLVKAQIVPEASGKPTDRTGTPIPCMFNPETVTVTKQNEWDSSQNNQNDAPQLQFQRGKAGTFSFSKLILDTTDRTASDRNRSVAVLTDKLFDLMKVDEAKSRPPWVRFRWGPISSFTAVITSIAIDFTYFASDGTPLRAEVDISLEQFRDENDWSLQNPTSQTPTPHRTHQIVYGETLESIAYRYYGKAGNWRTIAAANAILDPLLLRPGTVLMIPELEAASRA